MSLPKRLAGKHTGGAHCRPVQGEGQTRERGASSFREPWEWGPLLCGLLENSCDTAAQPNPSSFTGQEARAGRSCSYTLSLTQAKENHVGFRRNCRDSSLG